MAKKPRVKLPKKAEAGSIVQVKTLTPHKMETGNRKDKKGNKIPQMIITDFSCKLGGKEIFGAKLHASVSADPFISFFIKAESGTYDFSWTDTNGKVVSLSKKMAVS